MPHVVADDIRLDDAPMERFGFSGGQREASLEVDAEEGGRILVHFRSVCALRFAPMFDRRALMAGGLYLRTLLEVGDSPWLKDMNDVHAAAQEPMPQGLRHFIIPGDDGVWEVLAKSVRWERL